MLLELLGPVQVYFPAAIEPVVKSSVWPVHSGPLLPTLVSIGFTYTIVKPKVSVIDSQASPLITLLKYVVPTMSNGLGL